ncbi:MAG: beta-ketoacyl synthase [Bacteroidetes bacterium]|nr:beta-ketoacyl synthase [Bacteroidota bacterium]
MKPAHIHSVSVVTAIGDSLDVHHDFLERGVRIRRHQQIENVAFEHSSVLIDEMVNEGRLCKQNIEQLKPTRLEELLLRVIRSALQEAGWRSDDPMLRLVLSTTKGNIEELDTESLEGNMTHAFLGALESRISSLLNLQARPMVISNACTSGVVALNTGSRILEREIGAKVIVAGGDIISRFTLLGFKSLEALDDQPCKPYDADRKGINLGEGAAAICMASVAGKTNVVLLRGASTNDANHISGPSRTGEGLYQAILKTMRMNHLQPDDLSFVNAHGTATFYNDEMESIAFTRAGIAHIPINSFKGHIGHTLGGAGLIESALSFLSLQRNVLYRSVGYEKSGTSHPLNIIKDSISAELKTCLKTASGFGGCNAVLVIQKRPS